MTEFNQVGDSNTAPAPLSDCAPVTGGREAKPNRRLSLRVTMPMLGLLIVAGLRFSMQETIANWYTCCSSGYYCWLCPYTGDDWPCEGGDDGSGDDGIGGGGLGGGQSSGGRIGGGKRGSCDGNTCGMPVWSVTEPSLNLWLDDTPLFYKPSRGSAISFRLLYKNEMDISENSESKDYTTSLFSVGPGWATPWRSYLKSIDSTNVFSFFNGLGGRITLTNNSTVASYRGQLTCTVQSNNLPVVQYPNGAREEFGLMYTGADAFDRYLLTKRLDPVGNATAFNYFTNATTSAICLTNVTDVDGKLTTLTYTNIANYSLVQEVTDRYGRKAVLTYDSSTTYPVLTNIADAIGISSSMLYDDTSFNLIQLSTPYTSVQFLGLVDSTGGSNKVLWIKETGVSQGVRSQVYLYADSGDTNKMTNSFAAWRPQTTNASAGYSFSNTFDATNSHLRNTFHWDPAQYALLPGAFISSITNSALDISSLQSSNYLHALMRHWLLTTNTSGWSASTSLSIERASSPNGVIQGQITWYDYDNKLGGDPQWTGTSFLPRYVAWTLPNGESRFTYNLRNSLGYPTNVIETYNDTSAKLKVRTNSFGYGANKIDLITLTNALNVQVSSNVFNASHQAVTNFNALNEKTIYAYDNNQRLTSTTLPSGLITTNLYGTNGFLFQRIDMGFRTNSYTWTNGFVYTHTNELGLSVTNTWDALGRLQKVTYPDGTYVTNVYDKLDITKVIDRMGFTNRYEYNDFRQVLRSIDALTRTNIFSYCDCGRLDSITDPLGNPTTFAYDYAGRRTSTLYPDNTSINNYFDSLGRITNSTDSSGASVTNWFNNQGMVIAVSNKVGQVLSAKFDIVDRATNNVDANGVSVVSTYDDLNRVLTRKYPDNGQEKFVYTINIAGITSYTNQLGSNVVNYAYDALGRKTNEVYPSIATNSFAYDADSSLTTLTDGNDHRTTWTYDQYGRVFTKKDHNGTNLFTFIYYPTDWLSNRVDALSKSTTYSYDAAGSLTKVVYPSRTNSYAYDASSRLTNMVDTIGNTTYPHNYTYTLGGFLESEDGPWDQDTVFYGWNNRLPGGFTPGPCTQFGGPSYWINEWRDDTDSTSDPDHAMAYLNNQAGEVLSRRGGDCAWQCLAAWRRGLLWTISGGLVVPSPRTVATPLPKASPPFKLLLVPSP